MKGITPIIGTILLLIISIAIVGFVFGFLSGIVGTSSEEASESMGHIIESMATRFTVDCVDVTGDNLYIRNTGTYTISDLTVYVDGKEQAITLETIEPGSLGILSLEPLEEGEHTINVISAGSSVEEKVDVPLKWVVDLSVTGEQS
jgi:FlaG/FlaF family flagellin (archaellin)